MDVPWGRGHFLWGLDRLVLLRKNQRRSLATSRLTFRDQEWIRYDPCPTYQQSHRDNGSRVRQGRKSEWLNCQPWRNAFSRCRLSLHQGGWMVQPWRKRRLPEL